MHREERVRKLAERLKRDSGFGDELAGKVGNLGKDERELVIAAVVSSGLCDAKIVRAIRSEFGSFKPEPQGCLTLDEVVRNYDSMKRD